MKLAECAERLRTQQGLQQVFGELGERLRTPRWAITEVSCEERLGARFDAQDFRVSVARARNLGAHPGSVGT
jgi:hypothetical protein